MSETQELQPSSENEIPLADLPEPEPPKKGASPYVPGQPLPRLWKTEPDPEEDLTESLDQPGKKKGAKGKEAAAPAYRPASQPKAPASKAAQPKPKKKREAVDEKGEKRVLLEETPAFDTIETRQRARLVVGGLMVFCVFIFGWIAYNMLFSGSGDLTVDAVEMPPEAAIALPGPKPSPEPYARYTLDRAREYAKRNQTKQAVEMLHKVVSIYKGTQAAGEAQAALDRPKQNLPLFPDGPFLVAEKRSAETNPSAGPANPPASERRPGGPSGGPATLPGSAAPPPSYAIGQATPGAPAGGNPGAMAPGASTNPGTVGPAPPAAPGHPNVAGTPTAAPPDASAGRTGAMPSAPSAAPPPATGPVALAPPPAQPQPQPQPQPVPPGPGEAATLIPAPPGNGAAPPKANDTAGGANDRAEAALRLRPRRTLPPGFKARDEAGYHESGWPLVIVGERDGGIMVLVPGGTFTMGSDRGDPWNGPAHSVRLSTYYIDQYEVTNRQFRHFLEETRYFGHPPGKWLTDEKLRSMPDNTPVVSVSYRDAEEYTMWALKRLPTEAQWEMAARSADGRRYPWGDQPIRWSRPRKFHQIDPVTSFPEDVSPLGVFDLAGNAVEWVRDWYDPRYFDKMRDKTTEDPAGPPEKRKGIQRVVKGGSRDWLVFDRQGMDADQRLPYLGFRCSLAVEGGEASAIIAPRPPKPEAPKPDAGQPPGGTVPF